MQAMVRLVERFLVIVRRPRSMSVDDSQDRAGSAIRFWQPGSRSLHWCNFDRPALTGHGLASCLGFGLTFGLPSLVQP